MTDMEAQANEFLRRKEWARAIEIYNQLLNANTNKLNKEKVVSYLLGRSECCLELGQHEAVVSDCRRIIKLLADGNHNNNGARACRRLIQALFQLRRFSEAEIATKEWLSLFGATLHQTEVTKILEKLHSIPNTMEVKTNNQLESELRLLETKLEGWMLRNGHAKTSLQLNGWQHDGNDSIICSYCCISFNDRTELRAHCQSETHQMFIMSDEGRDWIWRPPPRGLSDAYTICENWSESGACRYGAQCVEAHGVEELAEWKERFEYRRMKLQRASEKELYGKSYTEQLLERWIQAPTPERVMREKLEGIEDNCNDDLITTVSSKTSQREWTFTLTTQKFLYTVALLQDAHRNHFTLKQIKLGQECNRPYEEITNNQEWSTLNRSALVQNELSGTSNGVIEHQVTVSFDTDIYGTFRQSVVFDFGSEPVLVKHLCVDVIPVVDVDKIKEIRKEMVLSTTERWDIRNSEIISFASSLTPSVQTPVAAARDNEWERDLTSAYPFPQAESFSLTHATVTEKKVTRNNYRARMHELLFVEEMARYEQVARYNLTAKLRITQSYLLTPNGMATSTAKYSHSGELFALMQLGKDISEDTSSGRLILNNCTTVLIASENAQITKDSQHKLRVYEASIEDKGKNVIYLRLSAMTVKDLKMSADSDFTAQVQFQLNRIPHCEWHYAIDKIADFRIIFPETYLEPNIPWTPQRQWSDTLDSRLNLKQKEAVVAITTPTYITLPPILIIGPFGTGKTFTLAQAIKQLLLQSDTRILICTHSNSAADLYIKDYLHPHVESGHEDARPLRIYYHKRWVATVNSIVQKYCLIDLNGGIRNFRIPTLEDIMKHRIVVVTLSISMYLSTMGLPQGHFTHILLDEAAQAMECEAIMPLALATSSTRIVLAGDHMQLSPELFSQFCKERNLHVSLLERLYDHYPTSFACKILLCENYRAHEAIINFTSELFYEQKLISSGKQPRHEKYYPLTFFTTRGEDVQDQNSTAFYNNSEVYEVVERVSELRKNWPAAWGKLDDQSIGIMTPYADQVFRIRSELRKRRLGGISVERVLNVQGKQFRAIFLSTVRTRRTCTGSTDEVDYGFLSNSKLLNTAITRAQSLVAVVGDPVALCSVGRCRKVWERFIQICNENNSLFGITWTLLKNQLDGVELKKTYVLNPLAPEFVPRKFQTEAYIRTNGGVQYNVPPMPVQLNPNQQIQRFMGPFPQPKTSPMYPGVVPMYYYPPIQPPQPPPPQFQIRPPPPQTANQWPVNNLIVSPTTETQNPSNWNVKPYVSNPNLDIQHLSPSTMLPINNAPVIPPQKTIPIPSPQMVNPVKTFPDRNVREMMIPPPYLRPNIQNPSQQGGICLPMHSANKLPIPEPVSRPIDKEVMFLHNVHFPEVHRESPIITNNQMAMNHRAHNGFAGLLPPNMSLDDMLMQPRLNQAKWYHHLHETEGMEIAKRFEILIQTALEKARQAQINLQIQNQLEALRSAEEFDKTQQQLQMLHQVAAAQPPPPPINYPNVICQGQNILPTVNNWMVNHDKIPGIGQLNFNKPIYLQDLEASIVLANLQNQQQANEEAININNAMFGSNEAVPWQCNPSQSVPLYRRQGPQNATDVKNAETNEKTASTSGAFAGYARAAINNGIYDVNRISEQPREYYQPCNMPNSHMVQPNWQHDVNSAGDFSKTCPHETVEEMIRRNATYASVLRSEHKSNDSMDKGRDPFSVFSDFRPSTTAVNQTEPGLYQYFA